MQFALVDQKLTNMKVQDLDRSSFIDYISQVSLKNQKNGPILIRNEENHLKQTVSINPHKDRSYIRTSLEREVERGSFISADRDEAVINQLGPKSKLVQSMNDQTKINAR